MQRVTSAPMAIDMTKVTDLDVEPGTLPDTMAAWVIREEREGEDPGTPSSSRRSIARRRAFEVIVRVMAAGVNYNNVSSTLGEPVGVWRYGDHPEFGHRIGSSDASGVVWKVGAGVTRWKPGDEVVVHCNAGLLRGPGGARARPAGRPRRRRSGATRPPGARSPSSRESRVSSSSRPQNLT